MTAPSVVIAMVEEKSFQLVFTEAWFDLLHHFKMGVAADVVGVLEDLDLGGGFEDAAFDEVRVEEVVVAGERVDALELGGCGFVAAVGVEALV